MIRSSLWSSSEKRHEQLTNSAKKEINKIFPFSPSWFFRELKWFSNSNTFCLMPSYCMFFLLCVSCFLFFGGETWWAQCATRKTSSCICCCSFMLLSHKGIKDHSGYLEPDFSDIFLWVFWLLTSAFDFYPHYDAPQGTFYEGEEVKPNVAWFFEFEILSDWR